MEAVLGDGLGSEIHNWLEACVARTTVRNAGEFNGFLKPRERLLTPPMPFRDGSLHLPAGYRPAPDPAATDRFTIEKREFFPATRTTRNLANGAFGIARRARPAARERPCSGGSEDSV